MIPGMIGASADTAALAARLATLARRLAEARAAALLAGRSPRRWRSARLLWPLFGRD